MAHDPTPFFMTHHAPFGAWSSLTFGLPGHGLSIDHQSLTVVENANFLVGVSRGAGAVQVLPFYTGFQQDLEMLNLAGGESQVPHWSPFTPAQLERRLTACVDEFRAPGLALRVYTPNGAVPDPATGVSIARETCPGLLLELRVDNASSDRDAWAFIGLDWKGSGRIVPVDWTPDSDLCGITLRGEWALAARRDGQRVFAMREFGLLQLLAQPRPHLHNAGQQGCIALHIPAGQTDTLVCAFGFYHAGTVTQGIPAAYWYTRDYESVEQVCAAVLDQAGPIRAACAQFDRLVEESPASPAQQALFAQSIRGYTANTQLLTGPDGRALFNVCEGQFCWRNTLDLMADHLGWELWRTPWLTRDLMDLYLERYAYRDQIRLPGESGYRPGGLAFTHDMGSYTAYSPAGQGGYEMSNTSGYSFMTTEQVLNGIYCITAYVLAAHDQDWAVKRLSACRELAESLANRDHPDPQRRDGLLKGESSKVGEHGHEITTYDCLDASLQSARGNLYIVIKTWCAYLLLEAFFQLAGDPEGAQFACVSAQRTAAALLKCFNPEKDCFPSNLLTPTDSQMAAALEPLAVPLFVGLEDRLRSFEPLSSALKRHILTSLRPGACLDAHNGGLRLVSTSANTWPSKGFLVAFVCENYFHIDLAAGYPTILREFLAWMQVAAAEKSLSDQIMVDGSVPGSPPQAVTGIPRAHNGSYYPRMVTSSFWVKPRAG